MFPFTLSESIYWAPLVYPGSKSSCFSPLILFASLRLRKPRQPRAWTSHSSFLRLLSHSLEWFSIFFNLTPFHPIWYPTAMVSLVKSTPLILSLAQSLACLPFPRRQPSPGVASSSLNSGPNTSTIPGGFPGFCTVKLFLLLPALQISPPLPGSDQTSPSAGVGAPQAGEDPSFSTDLSARESLDHSFLPQCPIPAFAPFTLTPLPHPVPYTQSCTRKAPGGWRERFMTRGGCKDLDAYLLLRMASRAHFAGWLEMS